MLALLPRATDALLALPLLRYIGTPSHRARYEILRSCMQELTRVGIVAAEVSRRCAVCSISAARVILSAQVSIPTWDAMQEHARREAGREAGVTGEAALLARSASAASAGLAEGSAADTAAAVRFAGMLFEVARAADVRTNAQRMHRARHARSPAL